MAVKLMWSDALPQSRAQKQPHTKVKGMHPKSIHADIVWHKEV